MSSPKNRDGSTTGGGGASYDEAEFLLRWWWLWLVGEDGGETAMAAAGEGETEETGLAAELKLGQVPRLRCSEAVREGLEAEKTASHREHLSLTALGRPVSVLCSNMGSRCGQYQAPLPFIALVRTVSNPW